MKISRNFILEELTASDTGTAKGMKNDPEMQEVVNLYALVHDVLQPIRNW